MPVLTFFFAELTVPSAISLAVSVWAAGSGLLYLTHDAEARDFDPRPLVRRALDTDAGAWLVVAVFNAKADAREFAADARSFALLSLRETAVSVAALLALLLPASEATR